MQFTSVGPVAKESLRREQCDLFIENMQRALARPTAVETPGNAVRLVNADQTWLG